MISILLKQQLNSDIYSQDVLARGGGGGVVISWQGYGNFALL